MFNKSLHVQNNVTFLNFVSEMISFELGFEKYTIVEMNNGM